MDNENVKKDISLRLRKIEGQVKGIEKMIERDACCKEILTQIAAIRAAINKTGALIIQNYAKDCLTSFKEESNADSEDLTKELDEVINSLIMFIK